MRKDQDTRKAMADQVQVMIEEADDATSRAAVYAKLGYRGTAEMLQRKASDLRANAERLAERSGLQPEKG